MHYMIAEAVKYHANCLAEFYNQPLSNKISEERSTIQMREGVVFTEFVNFMEKGMIDSNYIQPVF